MKLVTSKRRLYYRLTGRFRRSNGQVILLRDIDGRITLNESADASPKFRPSGFFVELNGRQEFLTPTFPSSWR